MALLAAQILERCWANSGPYEWCKNVVDADPEGLGLCDSCIKVLKSEEPRPWMLNDSVVLTS